MTKILKQFVFDDSAQDMVEYTLLLAFIVLASAALFIGVGQQISSIWTTTNNITSQANSAASAAS